MPDTCREPSTRAGTDIEMRDRYRSCRTFTSSLGVYTVESDPATPYSEVEGFDINFMNIDPTAKWNITGADIQAEFPGAWALDCVVVPSYMNHIVTSGTTTAQSDWLCVLMRDNNNWWLAFYDPLDTASVTPKHSIYVSTPLVPITAGGAAPVALDADNKNFEVYVLCEDSMAA